MDTITLIRDAQAGDSDAAEKLFRIILVEHMPARVNRRKGRNTLVDDHEIESDFLMGAYRALESVKLDTGNPLLYMLWKGDMAVAQLFRARIQKGVKAFCGVCGATKRVTMRRGRSTCRMCGSEDVTTRMVEDRLPEPGFEGNSYATTDVIAAEMDAVFFCATVEIQVAEMRSLLKGRALELFDLIVVEQINRDTSQNYLREIADRWGCTTAAVSIHLRKLRTVIGAYLEGNAR